MAGNIALNPPASDIIRSAFEKMAEGNFNVQQVWKEAVSKGLKCSKNAYLVQGQHEPLICEVLFYDIQDTINGRKKKLQKRRLS